MKFEKKGFLQNLKTKLIKTIDYAGQRSEKFSRKSKVKINEIGIKKELEEKLLDLGGHVYKKVNDQKILNFEQDLILKHLIEQIKELENELRQLETAQKSK